jgi:hypothetical protein
MTPEECRDRAREAKQLAAETRDLWERELLFKIADQWRLLEAHGVVVKKPTSTPKLVVVVGKFSGCQERHAPRAMMAMINTSRM